MYPDRVTVEYIAVLRVAALIVGENKMAGRTPISAKYMASSWFLCIDGFYLEILPSSFVMQRQILINAIIFLAYVLDLALNTHKHHYRS